MPGKKLPESPLPPRAPNYANARGREATSDNEGIQEDTNPGVSPGSVPEPREETSTPIQEEGAEFQDKNYAQYMNRGDGRYLKLTKDEGKGTFSREADVAEATKPIHRLKRD